MPEQEIFNRESARTHTVHETNGYQTLCHEVAEVEVAFEEATAYACRVRAKG